MSISHGLNREARYSWCRQFAGVNTRQFSHGYLRARIIIRSGFIEWTKQNYNPLRAHPRALHAFEHVATRNFTRTDIAVAISSFPLESNQFTSFYDDSLFLSHTRSLPLHQTSSSSHQAYFTESPSSTHQPFIRLFPA